MMKSSTQITLIVLAAIVLALLACLPLTMLAHQYASSPGDGCFVL
jgi:hypothetical protein